MAEPLIELLDDCPLCGGIIEPHCVADPKHKRYSSTCDIVRCQGCKNTGSIDGRWWPKLRDSREAYGSVIRDFVRREAKALDVPVRLFGIDEDGGV